MGKVNPHGHAGWNLYPINTVHVVWIVVWISGTFQYVVDNGTTSCWIK